jgi:hypothetical protein
MLSHLSIRHGRPRAGHLDHMAPCLDYQGRRDKPAMTRIFVLIQNDRKPL